MRHSLIGSRGPEGDACCSIPQAVRPYSIVQEDAQAIGASLSAATAEGISFHPSGGRIGRDVMRAEAPFSQMAKSGAAEGWARSNRI